MQRLLTLISLVLLFKTSVGQPRIGSVFKPGDFYASKTNFKFIDTLARWQYQFDTSYTGSSKDTVKSLGRITFYRTIALYDTMSRQIYDADWRPVIDFEIFSLRDSIFCFTKSKLSILLSSCVPPDVGGDIFIIGNFIFLNRSVCINCAKYDTGIDYCRPIVKYVFSKVGIAHIAKLQDIVKQFPIKAGRFSFK